MARKSINLVIVIMIFGVLNMVNGDLFAGLDITNSIGISNEQENPFHQNSNSQSPGQESTSVEDNFSSEDDDFIHWSTVTLFHTGGSSQFQYVQNSSQSGSRKPPFSPPEFQSC